MKRLSRLTALLLAMLMIISTLPVSALASETTSQIVVDIDTWNQWVQDAKDAQEQESAEGDSTQVETETVTTTIPLTSTYSAIERTTNETSLSVYSGAETENVESASLPIAGNLILNAFDGASTYQWQVQAAGMWVSIMGDTDSSINLTYAKLQNVMENDVAYVRCVMTANGADYVSATAKVTLDPTITYTEVTSEYEVEVKSEQPVQASYASPARMASYGLTRNADAGIATAADEPGELTKNYVIINYYLDDEPIADPKTFEVETGADYTATVPNPTVQGYKATMTEPVEGVTFTEGSLTFAFTNITEDITINVIYQPAEVNYTVIHYLQNVDNDEYSIALQETRKGTTNETVPASAAPDYPGFKKLVQDEMPKIAADGSTVVEVYYLRLYYLMIFDLDGGYGVEPIYARYGATIGDVDTPIKAGYTFQGWTRDGASESIPSEMPAENRTYKATWKAVDTASVTVVFWEQNPNDDGYSYEDSFEVTGLVPGSTYIYGGGTLTCTDEEHSHVDSCYTCNNVDHRHSIGNGCYVLHCTENTHIHSSSCGMSKCSHLTHEVNECYVSSDSNYELVETTKPSQITADVTTEGIYTYTTSGWGGQTTHYYLYLNNKWYCVESGSWGAGGDDTEITISCTHKHADSCYDCGLTTGTHVHSIENCYTLSCATEEHSHVEAGCVASCGKTLHSHNANCFSGRDTSGDLDTSLYEFVKSDVVTVAADGSTIVNVYYDRVEFTLTFKYSNQTLGTITKRWGANIVAEFTAMCDAARAKASGYSGWHDSTTSKYVDYIGIMPKMDKTLTVNTTSSSSTSTMTYYIEALDGSDEELFKIQFAGSYSVTTDEYYELEGFTIDRSRSTDTGDSCNGAKFYYTRNTYALDFNNGNEVIKSESVKYEAPLSAFENYVPTPPVDSNGNPIYEPGSVTFGGWYLNPECTGEQYILSEHTMPSSSVLLYAKWVPVTHNVTVYLTYEDSITEGANPLVNTFEVPHGKKVEEVEGVTIPTADEMADKNDPYNFVFWFYIDENGEEKAFDFDNMPVTKDMVIYAKWSSDKLVPYIIYYVLEGTGDPIADATVFLADVTEGSALAGTQKTFYAKGNTELYADYRSGYFPVTKSHTITFDVNTEEHVYEFEYRKSEPVPYTVRYLDAETKEPVVFKEDNTEYIKEAVTSYAVVTENFVPVSGYVPDAFQKRLVVSLDGDNELIFYYTKDSEHAVYMISHYTENLDSENELVPDDFTVYDSETGMDEIGATITADDIAITGFTFKEALTEAWTTTGTAAFETGADAMSVELPEEGLHIKLYYTRNDYNYVVNYLEEGTGKVLATQKTGSAPYGKLVTENAKDIANYDLVSAESQSITIKAETSATPILNVINFYYEEKEVTIKYEVVGPAGCGTVDPTSETLKVLTGEADGSTATANEGYTFAGWFDNAACTGEGVGADLEFVPTKPNNGWVETTFYAKFVENDVTINYVAVGPEGATNFGSVAPESETVKYWSGTATGSTATAGEGYKFAGWYSDAACNTKVGENAAYAPEKDASGKNVAATYYAKFVEQEVTINYVAVGPEGATNFGSVDPTTETVLYWTGTANGSTATAGTNYHFAGWYTDEACETAVDSTLVDENNKFVPAKVDGKNVAATYYAKFEEDTVDINYVVVGPEGCGTVTPESETIKVLTDDAAGSTAAATTNYHFVGWYTDEACETAVDSTLVDENNKFVPAKDADGKNVEATYYAKFEEDEVTINYVAVGPTGETFGTVSPTEETVKVLTGTASGSVANANDPAFKFVGWFKDEACTQPVDSSWVTSITIDGAVITPEPVDHDNDAATAAVHVAATYYAKFDWYVGNLKITKANMQDGESAIFKVVVGDETYRIVLNATNTYATISGLLHDTAYTVTEESWSWSYNGKLVTGSASGNIVAGSTITVGYENTKTDKWLYDESSIKNVFRNPEA